MVLTDPTLSIRNQEGRTIEVEVLAFDEFGGHRNAWTAGGEFAMDVLSGKYSLPASSQIGLWPVFIDEFSLPPFMKFH